MADPFRFFKPSNTDSTGYDPGVNRQTLGIQRVSEVALSGQGCETLTVRPNDPSVVDIVEAASVVPSERRFRLTGTKEGDAMLEAKDGSDAVVAFMQIHVAQPPPSLGPPVSAAPRTGAQTKTTINVALRTSPFPAAYADYSPDPTLQSALDAAIAAEPSYVARMTTAIVALNSDGTRPLAQYRGSEEHYGASMIKIAAMYAAYELRATLRSIADELGSGVQRSDVLKQASAYLDPKIMAKVATISPLARAPAGVALPRYASTFDVVPKPGVSGFTVDFTAGYQTSLQEMIGPSSNPDAAICVHGLGYGYINGALVTGGFFDPAAQNGIWLAGDYKDIRAADKYPAYRIPCVNDVNTAQGATALQAARLMALLWDKRIVGARASGDMLSLLATAPPSERYSHSGASANFEIVHVKIGYGPLQPSNGGISVQSEASIVRHKASKRMFAVGWLNLPHWGGDRFEPISARLARTFDKYTNP